MFRQAQHKEQKRLLEAGWQTPEAPEPGNRLMIKPILPMTIHASCQQRQARQDFSLRNWDPSNFSSEK